MPETIAIALALRDVADRGARRRDREPRVGPRPRRPARHARGRQARRPRAPRRPDVRPRPVPTGTRPGHDDCDRRRAGRGRRSGRAPRLRLRRRHEVAAPHEPHGRVDVGSELAVLLGERHRTQRREHRARRGPGSSGARRRSGRAERLQGHHRLGVRDDLRACRAAVIPIETWSSCPADDGIESTDAGCASDFDSDTSDADCTGRA